MNKKIKNSLFFIISFFLIFNNIPKILQMGFLGGPVGSKLVFYPLAIGFIYTAYCQYKYKNILVHFDKFLKFSFVYIFVSMLSLIIGLYTYSYYDVVFNGPVGQIEKLPIVIKFFENHGIMLDQKLALGAWMIARQVKAVVLETFWCFGGAYMIFCWYYHDWQKAVSIMEKGVLAGLVVIFAYSGIEVFYLAGNETAKNILEIITPYFHPVKVYMGWHPPLLWKGQLRSVFSEPSNIGNYIGLTIPVLWCCYLRKNSPKILITSFILIFFVFLTQARTAYAMLFGMTGLFFLLLWIIKRIDLLKKFVIICFTGIVAFGVAVQFIEMMNKKPVIKSNVANSIVINKIDKEYSVNASKVIEKNFTSLASSNKRSNGARYALIKSNLRIWFDNPVLGVGKGLAAAYIVDYYTDEEKKNNEVNMWVKYQKERGVFASGYSLDNAFNEYVTRLAQNGIIGLGTFLLPFVYVIKKLFVLYKKSKDNKQLDILLILFALISCMVSGMNTSVTVLYSTWILLGIAFAIIYSEKDKLNKCE